MNTRLLVDGLGFPESPRWHRGRLHFADWATGRIHRLLADGGTEVLAVGSSFPLCFDFLPDGRMVVAHGRELRVLEGGDLVRYADLSDVTTHDVNDVTVAPDGTVYVNAIGFDFMGGEAARPGMVAAVGPGGVVRSAATGVMFPNGMVVLDGSLLVAESYGERITAFTIEPGGSLGPGRAWAATPGHHPDGICAAPDGSLWYADVATAQCVNVGEGGQVRRRVGLDRGAFACALGDGVLYVTTNAWGDGFDPSSGQGQVVAVAL